MNRFPRIVKARSGSCGRREEQLLAHGDDRAGLPVPVQHAVEIHAPRTGRCPAACLPRRTTYFSPLALGMFSGDPDGMPRPSRMSFQLTTCRCSAGIEWQFSRAYPPDWVLYVRNLEAGEEHGVHGGLCGARGQAEQPVQRRVGISRRWKRGTGCGTGSGSPVACRRECKDEAAARADGDEQPRASNDAQEADAEARRRPGPSASRGTLGPAPRMALLCVLLPLDDAGPGFSSARRPPVFRWTGTNCRRRKLCPGAPGGLVGADPLEEGLRWDRGTEGARDCSRLLQRTPFERARASNRGSGALADVWRWRTVIIVALTTYRQMWARRITMNRPWEGNAARDLIAARRCAPEGAFSSSRPCWGHCPRAHRPARPAHRRRSVPGRGETLVLPEVQRGNILDRQGTDPGGTTRMQRVSVWTPAVTERRAGPPRSSRRPSAWTRRVLDTIRRHDGYAVIKRRIAPRNLPRSRS